MSSGFSPEYKRPGCCNYCHTHLPPSPLIPELLRNLITLKKESQNIGAARFLVRSIISLSRDFLQKNEPIRFNGKKERIFQDLMEYLSDNFSRQISREEIAKVFHLNPCYVSRLIREKCGKTLCEVLCDLRMEHAACLLTFDDLLIDEIAFLCGYMSTQIFTTMFRQHFSLPPGKYRVRTIKITRLRKSDNILLCRPPFFGILQFCHINVLLLHARMWIRDHFSRRDERNQSLREQA